MSKASVVGTRQQPWPNPSPTHTIRAVGQLNLLSNYTIILHRVLLASWNKISEISGKKVIFMSYTAAGSDSLVLYKHGKVTSNSPLINLGLKDWNMHFSALIAGNPHSKPPSNRTQHPWMATVESRTDTAVTTWSIFKVTCGCFTASLYPAVSLLRSLSSENIYVLSYNPLWLYTTKSSCLNESPVISMAVAMTLRSRVLGSELRYIYVLNTKHIACNPREKKIFSSF